MKQNSLLMSAVYTVALLTSAGLCKPLAAQAPAVVATSTATLASGFSAGPTVTDACGDVYVYEGGGTGIVEIQAGTGIVTTVAKNPQGYPSVGPALYMDAAKKNLYFPDFTNFYTTHFDQLPIVNCVPGAVNAIFANDLGSLGNYYYGTVHDAAGDAAGNVYFTTTANVTQAIYKETFSSSANTYVGSQVFTWKTNINFIAADAAGDLFFVDDTTQDVYTLTNNGGKYPTTPAILVSGSHFGTIAGLSLDPQGDLYIADTKNSLLFEVPLEKGALNPADLFATASVPVLFKAAVDGSHNIYLVNYATGASRLKVGAGVAPATAFGSASATFPLTYVFNSATTPTTISVLNGTSTSSPFSLGGATTGACATGTAQAALSSCTVNPIYTPSAVGKQTSTVQLNYAGGSLVTNIFGTGQGAAATIDPGTVVRSSTPFSAPSGVAVDSVGDVFVTDVSANSVTEFAAGSNGAGTPVSTGTLTLSGPKAVAVDPAGNIFIADTGNNRIVEIPVVAGVLKNASAFALVTTVKAPQGVAVDGSGNLFIADTGDNTLILIPSVNGTLSLASTQTVASALNTPSALTFDQSGNLFVAESGGNDVLEFTAPVGSAPQVKVASGLSTPTGLASDASNSLFVVDSGSGSIFRFPNSKGIFGNRTLVGGTVVNPTGVAADANGNLYVTDTTNKLFAEITRVTAALQFGGVNVGSTGTQTGTINSSGNSPVTFQTPDYTVSAAPAPGFAVTNDTCTGATVGVGSSCAITATYSPTMTQLNAEEDLTFTKNANGTPVLQLIGTGAHITPSTVTLVLTSPAGASTLNAGQAVTFTATIGTGTNKAVAGGTVKFFVNGNAVATVAVTNGTAVLTQKNGLPSGSAVVQAVYSGDVINYSGSSAQLTETVLALADTLALTVNAPYNAPFSANDVPANATGPSLTFIATIAPSSTIAPGGTVSFFSGSTNLGVVSVSPAASGTYAATLITTALRSGTTNVVEGGSYLSNYNISAVYSGDSTYVGANSNVVPVTIVGSPVALAACALGSTPTCFANTTGATFSISPSNPTLTIASSTAPGQVSGATTLTVTSYGGWAGVLNFTCTGLPAYATCAPFPGAPLIAASTTAATIPPTTINFVINTNVPPLIPTAASTLWWVSGLGGLVLLGFRRRLQRLGYLRGAWLLSGLAVILMMGGSIFTLTACSSSTSASTPSQYLTPAGTSKVTITVHGAQNVVGSTTGQVQLQDSSVPPVTLNLVIQ